MHRHRPRKKALQLSHVDLRTILEFAVNAIAPDLAQRGHRLVVSLPADALWVHADVASPRAGVLEPADQRRQVHARRRRHRAHHGAPRQPRLHPLSRLGHRHRASDAHAHIPAVRAGRRDARLRRRRPRHRARRGSRPGGDAWRHRARRRAQVSDWAASSPCCCRWVRVGSTCRRRMRARLQRS